MPRGPSSNGLTIAQLEKLLRGRRSEISRLEQRRSKVARKLASIDSNIAALGGSVRGGGTGRNSGARVSNAQSLGAMIATALGKTSKPMKVGDIADAVQSAGYRTRSANFRSIVNQALIKDKRFNAPTRGLYQLKK